jgi:DNA-binding response OmpR family regulator/DNA-binding SARP family transcriptional activator
MTRVLVLEDDENLRELLCETLEDEGYASFGAANGAEAIAKVSSESYDVLVVDVRMEGMSGLEAFAHMRQQGAELACLVITGYATEEDSIRAIRLGVGDYLRKPFEMSELLQRLARVVAVSTRQRQSLQREQQLHRLAEWLQGGLCPPRSRAAGALAAQVARGLQLDSVQVLELQWAAALAQQQLHPPDAVGTLAEALECYRENWDGSGPAGLAGEAIPLPGRVVRLALLAADTGADPRELAAREEGRLDPHLLFTLDLGNQIDTQKQVRRLLELARGLLHTGQSEEAAQALRQAEPLAAGPGRVEVVLLLAGLEPAPLRLTRLRSLVTEAAAWSPRQRARVVLEAGLLLIDCQADAAVSFLRESYRAPEVDAAGQALARLGLWCLGQADPQWSPLDSLALLLHPEHEREMFRALPWLGPATLRWWLAQEGQSPVIGRWLRHAAGALVPALTGFTAPQRLELLRKMQASGHPPGALLQALSQETDQQVKSLALQLARKPATPEKPPPLHIRSFGSFSVFIAGRPAPDKAFRGMRNKVLLAYLCSSARPVPEDRVRETFWPEEMEKGRKGIYNALFNIRRALRAEGCAAENCDYLLRQQELLGLDLELQPWHDLWEVEKSLAQWRQLDFAALSSEVDKVLGWTESPYLDGCYMDWALERRESLERQLSDSVWGACERALQAEAWQPLREWTLRLLQLSPEHQKAAALRMRALCQLGRPEEALKTYDSVTRKLLQEYEMEPSTEMMEWATRAKYMV